MIPVENQAATHFQIARALFNEAQRSAAFMEQFEFDIAGHLINSLTLLAPGTPDSLQWAECLLKVANRAKSSASYANGLLYATAAQVLAGIETITAIQSTASVAESSPSTDSLDAARIRSWTENYSFTFALTLTSR